MKNILRNFLIIFVVFSLIISVSSISRAANDTDVNYDDQIMLLDNNDETTAINDDSSQDEDESSQVVTTENTVAKNYYYAGSKDVTISNYIQGDAFIFTSGTVTISSTIKGNAFICASSVTVDGYGYIEGSLFNVSKELNLLGSVDYNVYNVSSKLKFEGNIDYELNTVSEETNITGSISRDANISSKKIEFSDDAFVGGDLNYSAKDEANVPEDVVSGNVNFEKVSETEESTSSKIISFIVSAISYSLLVIVLFLICKWLRCRFIDEYPNMVSNLPKYLLIGLLALILTPVACILLLTLGITANISVLLITLYLALLLVASCSTIIVISKIASEKLEPKFSNINNTVLTIISIVVLSIVYKLIKLIPVFGTIITLALVMVGIGLLIKSIIPQKQH